MLAGSVGLRSEVGVGSTFWLDLPVTLRPAESAPGSKPSAAPSRIEDFRSRRTAPAPLTSEIANPELKD
jgi:hypothetical protein